MMHNDVCAFLEGILKIHKNKVIYEGVRCLR